MWRLALVCALLAAALAVPNPSEAQAAGEQMQAEGEQMQADRHHRYRHHSSEEHHSPEHHGHHSSEEHHSPEHHSEEHHSPEYHGGHHSGHHSSEESHHKSGRHFHGGFHKFPYDQHRYPHEARADRLSTKISKVDSKIEHLKDIVKGRRGLLKQAMDHGLEILVRLLVLEGDGCDKGHFQCMTPLDGEEHQCISDILVCDGYRDCRSNWDEDHLVCQIRAPVGSVWVGSPVVDHCTTRRPGKLEVVVTSVDVDHDHPSFPHMKFSVLLEYEDHGHHKKDVLHSDGYYDYANQRYVVLPPEDDRLGITCTFDGIRDGICFGAVVHEATLDKCAEFVLHRTDHHDDSHEDSHSDSHSDSHHDSHHSDSHHDDSHHDDSHHSDSHHDDSHHGDSHHSDSHHDDSHHSHEDSHEPWEHHSGEHRRYHLSDEHFW